MTFKTDKTNQFKGIDVDKKVYKPVPVTEIVIAICIIFGILIALDWFGIIKIVNSGM